MSGGHAAKRRGRRMIAATSDVTATIRAKVVCYLESKSS